QDDDELLYEPDAAAPQPEQVSAMDSGRRLREVFLAAWAVPGRREGIVADCDDALNRHRFVAWARRGEGLDEQQYCCHHTRRHSAIDALNAMLRAHGLAPTALDERTEETLAVAR